MSGACGYPVAEGSSFRRSNFGHLHRRMREAAGEKDSAQTRTRRGLLHIWAVRAALCDPACALRSASAWCEEFAGMVESAPAPIHFSNGSVYRDAFCEIIKRWNLKDARRFAAGAGQFVLLVHIHDEATMRLTSARAADGLGVAQPHRSAIQKNKVEMARVTPAGLQWLPVLTELQLLARKDAATLAQALFDVTHRVLDGMAPPTGTRILHCLLCDGLGTNLLATAVLLDVVRARWPHAQYFVLLWTCAAHATNLAVRIAIEPAGERSKGAAGQLQAVWVRFSK